MGGSFHWDCSAWRREGADSFHSCYFPKVLPKTTFCPPKLLFAVGLFFLARQPFQRGEFWVEMSRIHLHSSIWSRSGFLCSCFSLTNQCFRLMHLNRFWYISRLTFNYVEIMFLSCNNNLFGIFWMIELLFLEVMHLIPLFRQLTKIKNFHNS